MRVIIVYLGFLVSFMCRQVASNICICITVVIDSNSYDYE